MASRLRALSSAFPIEKRFKAFCACAGILMLGYVSIWLATVGCLVIVVPLVQLFQSKRNARNAVESADRLLGGKRVSVAPHSPAEISDGASQPKEAS